MYCQILTFTIDEMTHDGYTRVCAALTAECAELPGLVGQRWIVNPATHTLSGTLRWNARTSMSRARCAADNMTAAVHLCPTQVAEREIRLPDRAMVKPTAPHVAPTDDYDPRG
jgi:hypothetical protein